MENERRIDGELFEKMIFGGVHNLQVHVKTVNDLNVFPIPDGDTGENMLLTLQGGVDRLSGSAETSLGKRAKAMAQGMLLGARGNSGVILSQLFYGLSEGLTGLENADLLQFGNALKEGVKCAYGAVAHPVEGTILTVAREAAEHATVNLSAQTTVEEFFEDYLSEMKKSLERTPELLAILKESGVIDSGGAGLVYITEGFCKAIVGETAEGELAAASAVANKSIDFSKFDENTEMQFGYCTELLLQLQNKKTDIANFSVQMLIDFLETVGDSIVAFQTGTVVKIHVHTMTPWKVLEYGQQLGEFLTVKIENMTLQHNETVEKHAETEFKMPKRARRAFATVAVASGDGLMETFKEMGADYVVGGGQTNNPSAEDFIHAFDEVNADCIFVFPNNGNIVLAAKQAAKMYEGSDIRVIESKNIGQGYSALSMLDYSSGDADEIETMYKESMSGTVTAMIARSVRTTALNGIELKKDGYMGFTDHEMLTSESTKLGAARALIEKLNVKDKEYLIVSYGKSMTADERRAFAEIMTADYPRVELYEIDGGQEVYDLLLIIE